MTNWTSAKNILCVRLDTIGDVIMTTPAMRALKTSQPDRRITLMTSSAGAAIAPLIPELDDVIVYDSPWLKLTAPRRDSTPEYEMIERLRRAEFDAAVIFTVYSQIRCLRRSCATWQIFRCGSLTVMKILINCSRPGSKTLNPIS